MNTNHILSRLSLSAVLLFSLIVTSCSKNAADHRGELLALVPDDAPITVAMSPSAILKSAGAEASDRGITLSKELEQLISKDNYVKQFVDLIASAEGIDYNCAVIAGGTEFGSVLFALENPDKFKSWAENNGLDVADEGAYTVCHSKDAMQPGIVIDNNIAWFIGSCPEAAKAVTIVESNKERCKNAPLAEWKINRLSNSDVNVLVNLDTYSAMISSIMSMSGLSLPQYYSPECKFTAADFNFDGPTLRMNGEAFDEEGKPAAMLAEGSYEPIPVRTLELVKDCQIAFAFTMPDAMKDMFGSLIAQEAAGMDAEYTKFVTASLNTLKSMTFGASLNENASIATLKPTDITATAAIVYNKTAADSLAKDVIALANDTDIEATLSNGWKAWQEDSTFVIAPVPQFPDFKIHFSGHGDVALVSTDADVKLSDDTAASDLTGYASINLKKSHPALKLLNTPFGIEIYGATTNMKSEGHITLTDCDTPILETLIKFFSRL